jgi:hypothetical protein
LPAWKLKLEPKKDFKVYWLREEGHTNAAKVECTFEASATKTMEIINKYQFSPEVAPIPIHKIHRKKGEPTMEV